ncbi:unnamed protein product [Effrenium voratum]|nr:unnamed protein product [Effrenium voratum]
MAAAKHLVVQVAPLVELCLDVARQLQDMAVIEGSLSQRVQRQPGNPFVELLPLMRNPDNSVLCKGVPPDDFLPLHSLSFTVKDPAGLQTVEVDEAATMLAQRYPVMAWGELMGILQKHTEAVLRPAAPQWAISLSAGSMSALDLALGMLLNPGDTILMEEYTFLAMVDACMAAGLNAVPLRCDCEGLLPEALMAAPAAKALYTIPVGHNPLGTRLPAERYHAIYDICAAKGISIIEDDAYFYQQHNSHDALGDEDVRGVAGLELGISFVSIDRQGIVLRLDSFAKMLCPGFRLGWVTGPKHFVEAYEKLCYVSSQHGSSLAMVCLGKLLAHWGTEGLKAQMVRLQLGLRRKCRALLRACEAHLAGLCTWSSPQAGMFLWLKLLHPRSFTHKELMDSRDPRPSAAPGGANARGFLRRADLESVPLVDTRNLGLSEGQLLPAQFAVRTGCLRRLVQQLFLHHVNPRFAKNAELACRGAVFLLLCAIPVIIPHGVSDLRDTIIQYGIYNSSVCCFIVFNMGRTVGQALDIAISGIKGTVLAAAMGWMLYTISPSGYTTGETSDPLVFWLGLGLGVIYVCLVMLLNFHLSLQMFAISGFAGLWMTFLNPEVQGQVTPPWSENWNLKTDTLLQGLICTGFGFLTVMLATLLPYPLWSLMYVQENQLIMNRNISQILQMMVDYYCNEKPNVYDKDAVLRHLREIKSMTDDNDPLIRAAWWECFGLGRTQLKRQVLHAMDQTCARVYDLAFNAWTVSAGEEAAGLNALLMRQVKPLTEELLQLVETLLNILVQAVEDGQLQEEEQQEVQLYIQRLVEQEKKLSKEFHTQRKKITQNKPNELYRNVRVAQVLHWTISRTVGEIIQLSEGVCKFSQDRTSLPPPPESEGMLAMFTGVLDQQHLLYAFRGLLSYFLCFAIGYFGFGEYIPARSSAIAATCPLLFSMYVGSAVLNDLNRIQGLMIGNVVARLARGFVDSCNIEDLALHAVITFLWVFAGLFTYFHSRQYSTVGCLAAAFGASTLLDVSCNHPEKVGKVDTFDALMMNCVAVVVTMIWDILLQSARASDLAFKYLDDCWEEMLLSFKNLLDPNTDTVAFHSATARQLLLQAEQMSSEADLEPRFWRTAWHSDLFARICRETEYLVIAVAALESAIAEHGRHADKKFPTFVKLSHVAVTGEVFNMFGTEDSVIGIIKFKAVKRLLKIFAHETVQKFDGFTDREATHYFQPEQEKVEANFMRETVPLFFGLEDDEPEENLSHDEMAHLSVVFAGFQRTTALVRRMQHKILTSGRAEPFFRLSFVTEEEGYDLALRRLRQVCLELSEGGSLDA